MSTCTRCYGKGYVEATDSQMREILDHSFSKNGSPVTFAAWSRGGNRVTCTRCKGVNASTDFQSALKNFENLRCEQTFDTLVFYTKTTRQILKVMDLSQSKKQRCYLLPGAASCVKSISDIRKIYENASHRDEKEIVISIWIQWCSKISQIEEVYSEAANWNLDSCCDEAFEKLEGTPNTAHSLDKINNN